jgi:hypothetical protein
VSERCVYPTRRVGVLLAIFGVVCLVRSAEVWLLGQPRLVPVWTDVASFGVGLVFILLGLQTYRLARRAGQSSEG